MLRCNLALTQNLNYTINPEASYYLYKELRAAGLKILVYSGDADGMVPITGTRFWLSEFIEENRIPVRRPWRPWVLNEVNQNVSGMVWELEGLTFASIRTAGHMVPTDNPEEAFTMLDNFLSDTEFLAPADFPESTRLT
jgi:serine carboxypeptidase-like clade 2